MKKEGIRSIKNMKKSIIEVPEGNEGMEQSSIGDMCLQLFQKFPNQDINVYVKEIPVLLCSLIRYSQ
jgi:hypothetical protein